MRNKWALLSNKSSFAYIFVALFRLYVAVAGDDETLSSLSIEKARRFIPSDFLEAYNEFVTDVIGDRIFFEHSNSYGASAVSTFTLAHMLALINEKFCDLPTTGIDMALRTLSSAIPFAYETMTDALLDDTDIHMTSTIYSSNRSLEATKRMKGLRTKILYKDFSAPQVVIPDINGRINLQTYGRISSQLIPKGGWYGPSIWSFTKAVFVNTFFFKNSFATPFLNVGSEFFMTTRVPTLLTAGNFLVRQTDQFTSVSVPLSNSAKSLVVVLPRKDLKQFTPYLSQVFDSSVVWQKKPIILQLPKLNFTISNEYFTQLYLMGMNQTMCTWKRDHEYFLQPVSQALSIYLDEKRFEVASATGAQMNNKREFTETLNPNSGEESGRLRSGLDVEDIIDDEDDEKSEDFRTAAEARSIESEESTLARQIRQDENRRKKLQFQRLTQEYDEEVIFNRSFFWYLKDEVLGPIFAGTVKSMKTYEDHYADVQGGFEDIFRFQFWSCNDRHMSLMDYYLFQAIEHSMSIET